MIYRNEVSDGSRGYWLAVPAGDVNWRCRTRWVVADGTSKRSKISGWCKCGEQFHEGVGCSREKGGKREEERSGTAAELRLLVPRSEMGSA